MNERILSLSAACEVSSLTLALRGDGPLKLVVTDHDDRLPTHLSPSGQKEVPGRCLAERPRANFRAQTVNRNQIATWGQR